MNWIDEQCPSITRNRQRRHFKRLASSCDRAWLERFNGSSRDLVFICGMFRSGSTLLEQMLASHPGFVAGGESEFFPRLVAREFPDYPLGLDSLSAEKLRAWQRQHSDQLERLVGGSLRVTDKRPDNFLYLGLIKAVLPAARFVVTERDWRDIATSVYSVRLGPSQPYATSLEDIRHYISMQTKLVDHWEGVLGSDLMRVRYDDLVLQPQQTMTNLLTWLGESWDERCLVFSRDEEQRQDGERLASQGAAARQVDRSLEELRKAVCGGSRRRCGRVTAITLRRLFGVFEQHLFYVCAFNRGGP